MESQLWKMGPNGKRIDTTVYTVHLRSVPLSSPDQADEFTCLRFTIRFGASNEISIPSLSGWKYLFRRTANAKDEKGQVFGIDHAQFENLKDSSGKTISTENS